MEMYKMHQLFPLGEIVITPGVDEAFDKREVFHARHPAYDRRLERPQREGLRAKRRRHRGRFRGHLVVSQRGWNSNVLRNNHVGSVRNDRAAAQRKLSSENLRIAGGFGRMPDPPGLLQTTIYLPTQSRILQCPTIRVRFLSR